MKELKLGIIGVGHLGEAFLRALIENDSVGTENILARDIDIGRLKSLSDELDFKVAGSSVELAKESEVIVLAVKPQIVGKILEEIKKEVDGKLVISLAAGVLTDYMEKKIPSARVIRTMTNMGIRINMGSTAYCLGKNVREEDIKLFEEIFSRLGICHMLEEDKLDLVTGMVGSGPAYIYLVIDALAESAVNNGMDRAMAVEFACQTVKAAATILEDSGEDPANLIHDVATPGGTTVEGLKALEEYKIKEAFVKCVEAATNRSKEFNIEED